MGALLHDIGKGYPGDHTEAGMVDRAPARSTARLLARARSTRSWRWSSTTCSLPDARCVAIITDTATIEQVAAAVETVERLELLHALTEADSLATGPAAWGSWQAELVDELVGRVRHVLGGGDVAEVTWRLFPDAETLARMAVGTVDVRRDGDLITVVSARPRRLVQPGRRRVVDARSRRDQRAGPLRRARHGGVAVPGGERRRRT